MKYEKLIEEIVNSLLDETTLLQAYKNWDVSPKQIKTAGALRREASKRLGQKIGVASMHEMPDEKYQGGGMAFTPFILSQDQERHRKPGRLSRLQARPKTQADKLRMKLGTERPYVLINVSDFERNKSFVPTLGHELGHVVDPVQNEKHHAMSDLEGRGESYAAYTDVEPSQNELAMIKSEGRAWRVGRELQKSVGAFKPENEKVWKDQATKSLRSYTRPYKKS